MVENSSVSLRLVDGPQRGIARDGHWTLQRKDSH
jgi:hypothetical protein